MRVSGEVDLFNAGELKSTLLDAIHNGAQNLILSMAQVSYIDSTGIGALLATLGEVKKRSGQLKLAELSPGVNKVFQLTRLSGFFEIFLREADAINSMHA